MHTLESKWFGVFGCLLFLGEQLGLTGLLLEMQRQVRVGLLGPLGEEGLARDRLRVYSRHEHHCHAGRAHFFFIITNQ